MKDVPSPCHKTRCYKCRLHDNICMCQLTPRFDLTSRVTIIMHRKEYMLTSNSGILAKNILKNSKILFHGHENRSPIAQNEITPQEYENYILFPSPQATPLDKNFLKRLQKPLNLIVPDGNWRQAKKIMRSVNSLHSLPKVTLPNLGKSEYKLRVSPFEDGVCTFEAIARSLKVTDGQKVYQSMLETFKIFVDRSLWTRGKIKASEITGGL